MRLPMLCWAMLAVCVSAAAASQGEPRFAFRKGDVLTYDVRMSLKGTPTMGGRNAAYAGSLEGKLVLTVQGVRADGTAEVKLSTTGKGKMTAGGEARPLDEEPASPLIAVVKPNGAIVELRDEGGGKSSLMQSMGNLFAASTQIQTVLVFNYTLFGLQLPAKLPAAGKSYGGTYKQEYVTGADFDSMSTQLRNVPQTFVYKGPGKYEGRPCLVFTCSTKQTGLQESGVSIPTTFYFDDKQGRLLAVEKHAKNLGRDRMSIDETVKLVIPKPGG